MQKKNLQATKIASRRILIRRLSLDLLGLPPTLAESEEVINNPDPDAYHKLVERVLESPHDGERRGVSGSISRVGEKVRVFSTTFPDVLPGAIVGSR